MYDALYHLTREANVSSIREKGLVPLFKRGMCCLKILPRDYPKAVFLTDDPEYIIEEQLGQYYYNTEFKTLKINCSDLDVVFRGVCLITGRVHFHEFLYYDKIDPNRIEVL